MNQVEPYILEINFAITPQRVLGYKAYCSNQEQKTRLSFSALFANSTLCQKINDVNLTLWLTADENSTDDAVFWAVCPDGELPPSPLLAMQQLLCWLEHLPACCFTLTYMTAFVMEEDLPQFIPVMRQLGQLFQQSRFLQNIRKLCLNDYFEQCPTVFSLPNLTELYLSWDFDIDWNSVRQWQAPNLQTLWLNGVKHFTDVPDIVRLFPKLEKLYMNSQRRDNDCLFSLAPPYKGMHIPAQLKECCIENAEILEWEKE